MQEWTELFSTQLDPALPGLERQASADAALRKFAKC